MDIYTEANVVEAIKTRMPYVFRAHKYPGVPNLVLHAVGLEPFEAAGVRIEPIRVMHAKLPILGFRIGDFAYLTDLKYLPEGEFEKLEGLEVLVIDALRRGTHLSHEGLEEALVNIARIRPRQAYLTHMSHRIGLHAEIDKQLPPGVHYAYDGLVLELPE